MGNIFDMFGDDSQNTNNQDSKNNSGTQGNNASSSTQGNNASSSTQGTNASSSTQDNQTNGSLELHKEELDITKNKVDAGEVVLSKDVVEEQKTVEVPVMHEEVVIKRTPVNERSNATISSEETIHIPVSQEQVQVNKYTVTTEEVSASKRQVEETQQVQETLRRETANVNTTGSVDFVSDTTGFEDINNS
ncbi:YsnF/AvaK domain-containing protein [Neobacillus sp. DY30]|uniref:YsnF/AvaK domain-containing protein n=1 Tax=Neobacillus sp. DY30 TaxID=3047871 RepID=UPI0024C06D42|nr:YsnF/AvaK domain-containing protein [Neobacillus sp. DY30]WHY02555.1 YsnF/AvaK domain-containing protein [Neobacillus sp. DY30]